MNEWCLAVSALDNGDGATALEQFKKLALSNVSEALLEIGFIYEFGMGGIDIDYDKAFEWFQKSVEITSDPHAYLAVARCYFHGQGVEQNHKVAINIYKSDILIANPLAELVLGRVYQFGVGVNIDMDVAQKYLESSAAKGNVFAIRDLGLNHIKQGRKLLGLFWKIKAVIKGVCLSYSTNDHDFRIREF